MNKVPLIVDKNNKKTILFIVILLLLFILLYENVGLKYKLTQK